MQRNDVALAQQRFKRDVFDAVVLRREFVVGDDAHPEATADLDKRAPDLARADHADRPAVEIDAGQPDNAEIELARAPVRLVQSAVQREQQPHRVLGDGVRRIRGHAHDVQLAVRRLDVHIAVARAAHGDELHAVLVQPLHGERVDAVVDERADGVKAVRKLCGVVVQLFLKICDVVVLSERVEPCAVVRLGIEKGDFLHDLVPPWRLPLVCAG